MQELKQETAAFTTKSVSDSMDAKRYRFIRERFDDAKSSTADRIIDDLHLADIDSYDFNEIVDESIKRAS